MAKAVIVWRDFFTKNKIDVYSNNLECMPIETAGIAVAKRLGVKILNYEAARVSNRYHIIDDGFRQYQWKKASYEEAKKLVEEFRKKLEDKSRPQAFQLTDFNKEKGSLSVSSISKRFSNLIKNIEYYNKLPPIERKIRRTPLRIAREFIIGEIRRRLTPFYFDKVDLNEKFFFFPLHYTLESQLSYMESFSDQFRIIYELSRALPIDHYIYVKPHPHWLCSDIPTSKIRDLKKIPNVKFISVDISPFELIKKSKGVVTIDSTTGLEAMVLNKPLITFGHEFYAKEDAAIVIRDFEDIPGAIQKTLTDPKSTWDEKKRIMLLGRFFKHLVPVYGSMVPPYSLSDEEGKALADAMVECYKNYGVLEKA